MTQQILPNVYYASQQRSWLHDQLNRPEPGKHTTKQSIKHTGSNRKIIVETLSIYKKELS